MELDRDDLELRRHVPDADDLGSMATRLPTERVPVASEDLTAEVTRCASWPIQQNAVRLWAAFLRATGQAELTALRELFEFFVAEAQPTWDLVDHRGAVPPTVGGMLRVNHLHALGLVLAWTQTLQVAPTPSAVDELIPEGPLRDELNRQLRTRKREAST